MGNDVKKIRLSNLYICGLLLFFLSLNTYNYICFLNVSPDFISLIPNYLHYMIFWPLIFILLIVFLYLSLKIKKSRGNYNDN